MTLSQKFVIPLIFYHYFDQSHLNHFGLGLWTPTSNLILKIIITQGVSKRVDYKAYKR